MENIRPATLAPAAALLLATLASPAILSATAADSLTTYGVKAWKESARPVRPGGQDGQPFWNGYSKRFIYAPAFDFKPVAGATKYHFSVESEKDGRAITFQGKHSTESLSLVWEDVPVGFFTVTATGVDDKGTSLGESGKRRAWRAAPFNGIYNTPTALSYDDSARKALQSLLHKDYVEYWLTNNKPDPSYKLYRYPAKIYSALVVGAITQAKLTTGTAEAERSMKLAHVVADFMLSLRYPDAEPWAGHVPTYFRHTEEDLFKGKKTHMDPANHLVTMGVDAGNAFLDLYDVTGETRYLDAAKKICDTYLKTQQADGSWPLFVDHANGKAVVTNITIPTSIINYYDRLRRDYGVTGLDDSTSRALAFVMNGPVKTFNWQGQFEDVVPRPPYQNQSREQACELAMYLFRNKGDFKLAEDLIRFAEDQFVIWEQPMPNRPDKPEPGKKKDAEGFNSKTWITPSVQEQYVFWYPIGRSAGIMIDTYMTAYAATADELYLAKAHSLANTFPKIQQVWKGDYPTHFTPHKMNFWLNSVVYPSKILMGLD